MAFLPIATVNLALLTTAVSRDNFGTPLFLTVHRAYNERVRSYQSAEDVATDIGSGTPAHRAAVTYFSQIPRPRTLKIGRVAANVTFTPENVAEDSVYTINLAVNSNVTSPVSYTANDTDTAQTVVETLVGLINSVYEDQIVASLVGTGVNSQLLITPFSADFNFVYDGLINLFPTFTVTETAVAARQAADGEDADYAFVTSEFRNETEVIALSSDTQATERMYFFTNYDANTLTPEGPIAVDIPAKIKNLSNSRTVWVYGDVNNDTYPELGVIGRFSTKEPGTIDWFAKQIANAGQSRNPANGRLLNSTEQDYVRSRNGNAFVSEGGIVIFKSGVTITGEKIDNIRVRDFLSARLREGLTNWRINKDKIPYDQVGIDSAQSVVESILQRYVSTPERPHAVSRFELNFPAREQVSFANVAEGLLEATGTIYLTGSIFNVVFDGVVTFDAEF